MPRNKSGSANGGILGVTNNTSFGKNTVTEKTSSSTVTIQPGTRLIDATIVAGGGSGSRADIGELSKRKPLKKGIRLKGKGSSFMKEYKKRVYNRAGGGSVNGGARGTGIAVKGHNFKGVF